MDEAAGWSGFRGVVALLGLCAGLLLMAVAPALSDAASLTVEKVATNAEWNYDGDTDFPFNVNDGTGTGFSEDFTLRGDPDDPAGSNSKTLGNLAAGTYTITETPPGGWRFDGAYCEIWRGGDGGGYWDWLEVPVEDTTATVEIADGDQIRCFFYNQSIGISVWKWATPLDQGADPADFDFDFTTTGGLTPSSFTLPGGWSVDGPPNFITFDEVGPGEYEIIEQIPPGWSLDSESLSCYASGPGRPAPGAGNPGARGGEPGSWSWEPVTNADGEVIGVRVTIVGDGGPELYGPISCYFDNFQDPPSSITVRKQADPATDAGFDFDMTGGAEPEHFTLDGTGGPAGQVSFTELARGTYRITELEKAGWAVSGIECTVREGDEQPVDVPADFTVEGSTAVLKLGPGQDATCTFSNRRVPPSSITVVKKASPKANVNFPFSTAGGLTPANFTLNAASTGRNRIVFGKLAPGTYRITEKPVKNWSLKRLACTGPARSTVSGRSVSIRLGEGQDVTCTFTNRRDPKPDYAIRKRADRRKVRAGKVVTYRIGFRNTVPGSVGRNVLVCDNVPYLTSVAGRGGGFFRNGEVCWRVKKLAFSGRFTHRTLRLRVDRDAPGGRKIVNRAHIAGKVARAAVRVMHERGGSKTSGRYGGVTG